MCVGNSQLVFYKRKTCFELSYDFWYEIYFFDSDLILNTAEIFKTNILNSFWVKNFILNLRSRGVNTQRLFCPKQFYEMFILKISGIQYIFLTQILFGECN